MTIKQRYELIKYVMEWSEFPLEKRLKGLEQTKRELRKMLRSLKVDPFEETYHYRDEYGDSYYIKEFFDMPFTEEEKIKFIESQWQRIYSPYDCTGLSFTTSIRICNFKEPNSFGARAVVYHFLSRDV